MKKESFQDDEPIHHHAGKDIFDPCPRVTNTPNARRRSISLVTISPPVTVSPPALHLFLDRTRPNHGEQPCRELNNLIIVNHGGNLYIDRAVVNTMVIINKQ